MAAYRNVPACCRGKSPPTVPSSGKQPFASTPSCCMGAPTFDPSPSPVTESPDFVSAEDYNARLGDASTSNFYTAGQDTQSWSGAGISPHTDLYPEQEELAGDGTESDRQYHSAASGRCPAFQVAPTRGRSPIPAPAEWNTPKTQRRSDHIRRFNCKRRLTFHDVKEWVISGTEEVDAPRVEEIRGEPPPAVMLEYQSRDLSVKPDDDGCMETVYGPLPQHKYVPLWVYMARDQHPEVFQEALEYYFENTGWPELSQMDESFQEDCESVGISGVAFKKTAGFAPVWIFILDVISKANKVERKWFDICMDEFFENGNFPELTSMPEQLQQACIKMDVTDYDFYVPDM